MPIKFKQLKKSLPRLHQAFGSIHKDDDTDKKILLTLTKPLHLPKAIKSKIVKEDANAPVDHGTPDPQLNLFKDPEHVQRYKEKVANIGDRHGDHRERDAIEFSMHHALNEKHVSDHHEEFLRKSKTGNSRKIYAITSKNGVEHSSYYDHDASAIANYTGTSRALNSAIVDKHNRDKLSKAVSAQQKTADFNQKYGIPAEKGGNVQVNPHFMFDYEKYHTKMDRRLGKETSNKRNALRMPTIVHSGAGKSTGKNLKAARIGDKIHFPAYTSTSTHPDIAKSFAHHEMSPGGHYTQQTPRHVIHFHLPAGYYKGRHVENISRNAGEHEMILHKNQKFKKVAEHVERVPNPYRDPNTDGSSTDDTYIHHHLVPVSK